MHTDFGPGDESYDDNVEYLIDTLPAFMENSEDSGNWRLYTPVGNRVDELEDDLRAVDRATSVQHADTLAQLEELAKLVDLPHREGEKKEHYRSRLFARYHLNTAEGTLSDLLTSVSNIIDSDIENIEYQDLDAEATVGLVLPGKKVEQSDLTAQEIADILHDLVPAGYEVEGQKRGTYTYLADSAYSGPYDSVNGGYDSTELNSDASLGHDGLDSNGDPKGNGGTYAGIIN